MKKIFKFLTLGLSVVLLAGCSGGEDGGSNQGSGSDNTEKIELIGVELVASKTSCITGESVLCSFNPVPSNANTFNGKAYDATCIEYWVDGQKLTSKQTTFNYTTDIIGDHEITAYYCTHTGDCGHVGDLTSNKIIINVDLPESEKVFFKYDTLPDGTVSIYAGKLLYKETDVVIPAEIDGKVVSQIKDKGFAGLSAMRTLKFDKNLQSGFQIGKEAFTNCSKLSLVELPWQVTKVGSKCFNGSETIYFIEEQNVPNGYYSSNYTADTWNVGKGLVYCNIKDFLEQDNFLFGLDVTNEYEVIKYYGRDSEVTIPKTINNINVIKIRAYAFKGNGVIKRVNIPETVVDIYNSSFENCSLLSEIEFPEVCTAIGNLAFAGCSKLKYVYLPYSIVEVGKQCFKNCHPELIILSAQASRPSGFYYSNYSSDVWNCGAKLTFFDKLGFIHDGDFTYAINGDNAGLCVIEYRGRESNLVIPNSVNSYPVTEIGYYCFYEKNFIIDLTLPSSLKIIGEYGFSKCINMQNITLPETLIFIGKYGFSGCSSLKSIVIPLSVQTIQAKAFSGCPDLEIYVVAASRPSGFYYSNYSADLWNAGVKMTYWGVSNGWFLDEQGNPYHL